MTHNYGRNHGHTADIVAYEMLNENACCQSSRHTDRLVDGWADTQVRTDTRPGYTLPATHCKSASKQAGRPAGIHRQTGRQAGRQAEKTYRY